jgi:hypothetical protein
MSIQNPTNIQEWEQYVNRYKGLTLRELARTANTHEFFGVLNSEGFSVLDVKKILIFFARRMVEVGVVPPTQGVYDYEYLISVDEIASSLPRKDFVEITNYPPEDDVFDEKRTEPFLWEEEINFLDER